MDFHALEALQCMLERRRGGETGVKSVRLIDGDGVWKAAEQGRWSWDLLEAALSRSDSPQGLAVADGRTESLLASGQLRGLVQRPSAYLIDYADRTQATVLMLNGAVADYCFAARLHDTTRIYSTQFLLPPNPNVAYSTCLMRRVEEMIESGAAPYPVERTLLTSGVLESCLDSRIQGGRQVATPHLDVHYVAPLPSLFCQT
jgi:hypothetical protein